MQWLKEHDVALVREILLFQPWEHRHGSSERGMVWTRTSESLSSFHEPKFKPLDARSVRERYKVLEKRLKKENKQDMRASGKSPEEDVFVAIRDIVEQFDEALSLQQEAVSEKKKREIEEALQAEEMRNVSLESFAETKKRKKTEEKMSRKLGGTETLEYLKERAMKDDEYKKEEILLKKEEFQLQKEQQNTLVQQLQRQHNQTQQIIDQQQQQNILLLSLLQRVLPNNEQ